MGFIRALCYWALGGVGLLVLAGATLPQTDDATGADGAPPVAASLPGANPLRETTQPETVPPTAIPLPDSPAAEPGAPPPPPPSAAGDSPCLSEQACIDQYLWSLYQRTPKVDTISVPTQVTVTVKRKGKTRTVTKKGSKLVTENFAWKDTKAAEVAGMALIDYVIGGMDPGFRTTLYRALHMLDEAGFKPGITCAFRDDYRQSIATGWKAQNDRSYHGGSFRGGYGHGLAADIVSVKGDTVAERSDATGKMWDWIDKHEKELGIGRPYLNRDPPHIAPVDGEEYADHRLKPKLQHAAKAKVQHAAKAAKSAHAKSAKKDPAKKLQPVARRDDQVGPPPKRTNVKETTKSSKSTARGRIPAI